MEVEETPIFYDEERKLQYKLIRGCDNYRLYENFLFINMDSKQRKPLLVRNNHMSYTINGVFKQGKATRIMFETWMNKQLKTTDIIRFRDNDKTNLHYTNLINSSDPNISDHLPLDPMKIWELVKDYPDYKTSNYGDIFSIKSNRFLTPTLDCNGYLVVVLTNTDGPDRWQIHQIVYRTFVGEVDEGKVIDHKNRIRTDNFLDNLEEKTYSENNINSTRYKPRGHLVYQYSLDDILIKEWDSLKEICDDLNLDRLLIKQCCEGLIDNYAGFIWFYPEKVLDISDYYPIVSDDGKTYSKYRIHGNSNIIKVIGQITNMILKHNIRTGYPTITLVDDNDEPSTLSVHRLVALTFIPNDDVEKTIVNHKNENKLDARVENLEWGTQRYNVIYSNGIKVNQIDPKTGEILKTFDCIKDASIYAGIKGSNSIAYCCEGKQKTAKGFKWSYVDEDKKKEIKPSVRDKCIKVNQIDLKTGKILKTFDSNKAATDYVGGLSKSGIGACCKGKFKTAYGYGWSYVE